MVDMKEKVSSLNPILRLINPIQFGNPLPFSLYFRHGFCSESEDVMLNLLNNPVCLHSCHFLHLSF